MYFVSCFSFPIGGRLLTLLCREILLHEPFKFKLRSAQEREAWEKSADNFNAIGDPKFKVTPKSVRDRFTSPGKSQLICRMMSRKKEIILNGMTAALKRKRKDRYT